ncbi:envelope stress response protein PspG [Vibrio breoganii]|uniref:Phage shock protein G n=3 Tax=Vibrio TaxID=662 RepID=A0AAJ3VMG7_9VIBR|nr:MULTISPECIES: envelope stress response protein PspG [Vibrio]ANO33845.1 hypothetical protein A6E01_11780 [Vibrio breoganii]MDN3717438.1 envelope stress response protein PspG [Vibrio breoganii]NMO72763.1 hypothetical protein [Vibrio breoganii]NMR71448.1 hypothetical protein [Vibrio breoganii]OCH77647.1 hypothetical protein A6D95_05960 [Vibrio breoganii]
MFELLMLLMFFGVFFFTGLTFFGLLMAFFVVFAFSLVLGLLGAALKFLPYILLAVVIYWVLKRTSACS